MHDANVFSFYTLQVSVVILVFSIGSIFQNISWLIIKGSAD
jgi:hypothetical protein